MHIFQFVVTLSVTSLASLAFCSTIKPRSNLMFDYNWPEPDLSIKKYPHEKYCDYYYNVESINMYSVGKCPEGERFDYHSHECQSKELAKCWSHRYGKNDVHEHIHSKLRKHFKCPLSEGKYPDIFHCEKYFLCVDGKAKHKHCPLFTKFDKVQKECVDQNIGICADVTDASDVDQICQKLSGNVAHPKDCSKFYHCHKHKTSLRNCQKGKLFDEEQKHCKIMDHVHCGSRDNPYDSKEEQLEDKEPKITIESYDKQSASETSKHFSTVKVIKVQDTTNSEAMFNSKTATLPNGSVNPHQ